LAARVPTLVVWEGSRLRMMGLDALLTYKRVVAWFPGPAEDVEWYLLQLHRLNQGLDTRHWRVYEHKEEPNGVCLCSAMMQPLSPCWRGWVGGSSVEWGRLLSPFWVLSQRGRSKKTRRGGGRAGGAQAGYGEYHFFHSG